MVVARESLNEVNLLIHVPELANLFCAYYITFHSKSSMCGFSKSKGKIDYLPFCKKKGFLLKIGIKDYENCSTFGRIDSCLKKL
jgi:hypothetical protein